MPALSNGPVLPPKSLRGDSVEEYENYGRAPDVPLASNRQYYFAG
jgi:hypothetical protein